MTKKQAENLRKWVAALEGGEYRQTRGSLKGKFGYCCLGVYCDLRDDGEWQQREYSYPNGWLEAELDAEIRAEISLTVPEEERLIKLNDSSKVNFKRIAAFA